MGDVFEEWPDQKATRAHRVAYVDRELKRMRASMVGPDEELDAVLDRRHRAGLVSATRLTRAISKFAVASGMSPVDVAMELAEGKLVFDVGDPDGRDD